MSLKEEINYCAFIDVLGYRNIVMSNQFTTDEKIKILSDIYDNLLTTSFTVKELKKLSDQGLFIKSFSDCFYFESKDLLLMLYVMHTIYNVTFGYNIHFTVTEKYRPLLRGAIVKDWTIKIMDIGSLSRQSPDSMYQNEEFQNPIGLGVARAYCTSEESHLSGMRILISEEVIRELSLTKYSAVPFECYFIDCPNFIKIHGSKESMQLFFIPVIENEQNEGSKLFELCWPFFFYNFKNTNSDIEIQIEELIKRKRQFNASNIRHLRKTAELIYKAWQITLSMYRNDYTENKIAHYNESLKKIIDNN